MYVRMSTLTGARNVAAALDYLETKARPAVQQMTGHKGLAVLKDEGTGTVAVAAYWDTAEQLEASAGSVSKMRETVSDIAGGGDMQVEVYEAAVTKRFSMPPPGAMARLLRVQCDAAEIDAAVKFWVEEALPAIEGSPGLASAQLLIDRASGKGISVTGWTTPADLEAAEPALAGLVERVAAAVPSARMIGAEHYTIVSTDAQLGT